MSSPYKAIEIADHFIRLGIKSQRPISNMKLQKLIYYAQAYFMVATRGQPLFDEDFKRWTWGPVCPPVYNKFKKNKANPISSPFLHSPTVVDRSVLSILEQVWLLYGSYSAVQLSDLSHQETPWLIAEEYGLITKESIFDFFKTQVEMAVAKHRAVPSV